MDQYVRDSEGKELEVECIARPFSNFQFIDKRFPHIAPLRRLFSQVRSHGGTTMVIERLDPASAKDTSEENQDLQLLLGQPITSEIWRLSFFRKRFLVARGLTSARDDDFLGYAILKNDRSPAGFSKNRVFESVLGTSRCENNYIRGEQEWRCRVGPAVLRTRGYVYAQQNENTNACAHVACRTAAARFHRDGDMTYREMNKLPAVAIDHVHRKAKDGLTSEQMVAILEAAGARCIVADYTKPRRRIRPVPFQKYVYGSVESGFPAILFFGTSMAQYHAIPIFGHTFNEDMWVASAERFYFRVGPGTAYIPSLSWLSAFIAHDDNCGSNYCIPRHFLYTKHYCDKWPGGGQPCAVESECVAYAIATLPKEVNVSAIDAEVIAADYLFSMLPKLPEMPIAWRQRLETYAKTNLVVLRPILVKGSEYVSHLTRLVDWDGDRIERKMLDLLRTLGERYVWMVELSVPELFAANRRKIGEVLLGANVPVRAGHDRDFRSFLLARVPGHFAFCTQWDAANPKFRFEPSGISTHVPLFGCED